jgi:hypothetical protein
MKLSLEQRTKLFQMIRDIVLNNIDKINVISSDYPNMSFIYNDDKYEISYYHNQYGMGVAARDMVQIAFHDKILDLCVKFDSGDYILMKNERDMIKLTTEIYEKVFKLDDSETKEKELIDKVLKL